MYILRSAPSLLPNEHVHQGECEARINDLSIFPCQQLYNKKTSCSLTKGSCREKTTVFPKENKRVEISQNS